VPLRFWGSVAKGYALSSNAFKFPFRPIPFHDFLYLLKLVALERAPATKPLWQIKSPEPQDIGDSNSVGTLL